MANYGYMLNCPACGARDLNLLNYKGLMCIRDDLALFTLACSNCGEKTSSIQPIPQELRAEVEAAALEVGAGMGR